MTDRIIAIARFNWGTVPDWISGLGGLAVVAITLVVLFRERREKLMLRAADSTREAAAVDASRRYEASRVTWWIANVAVSVEEPQLTPVSFYGPPSISTEGPHRTVAISNANVGCLYRARVRLAGGWPDDQSDRMEYGLGVIPPGLSYLALPVVETGSPTGHMRQMAAFAFNEGAIEWLDFADSRGQPWRVWPNGTTDPLAAEDYNVDRDRYSM